MFRKDTQKFNIVFELRKQNSTEEWKEVYI